MKITNEHLHHGAVLNQIAEHRQFTAINALKVKGKVSRSAFKVNDDIGVYLKIASNPKGRFKEYQFTFNQRHIKELREIAEAGNDLHLALICMKDREICCLPYKDLADMFENRRKAQGRQEDQYQLLVTLKPGQAFRVYMNKPGKRGVMLGKALKIRRNLCPDALFR